MMTTMGAMMTGFLVAFSFYQMWESISICQFTSYVDLSALQELSIKTPLGCGVPVRSLYLIQTQVRSFMCTKIKTSDSYISIKTAFSNYKVMYASNTEDVSLLEEEKHTG